MEDPRSRSDRSALERVGLKAWALLGLLVLLGAVLFAAGRIMLVVVPLVLALFPAALLEPVSRWLKDHGVPAALAALITLLGSIALLVGLFAALVPIVAAELPELIETGAEGLQEVQEFIDADPMGIGIPGVDELLEQAQELVGEAGELAGQALQALTAVVEVAVGLIFLLVALFFYLKDDRRIARGVGDLLPPRAREDAAEIGARVWGTIGGFFRGQLLVALVDAIFIGLGLLILGIPLALPLAVLIFFGGLFPIVGAFITGALAVLVALADAGFVVALIVLAIILAVQQLESNVLAPVVLGHVIRLHPLLVIVSVTGGGILLGILGAFLAVPVVASIARVVEYLREQYRGEAPAGDESSADERAHESDGGEESEPGKGREGDGRELAAGGARSDDPNRAAR